MTSLDLSSSRKTSDFFVHLRIFSFSIPGNKQAIIWEIGKYMFFSAGCAGFGGLLNTGFCHSDVIRQTNNRHWTLRRQRHDAWQSPSFFHYISVRLREVISFFVERDEESVATAVSLLSFTSRSARLRKKCGLLACSVWKYTCKVRIWQLKLTVNLDSNHEVRRINNSE